MFSILKKSKKYLHKKSEYLNPKLFVRTRTKALHSELFAELSGRFSRRNEYSRDGTSSVKAWLFVSSRNFRYLGISELAITEVR